MTVIWRSYDGQVSVMFRSKKDDFWFGWPKIKSSIKNIRFDYQTLTKLMPFFKILYLTNDNKRYIFAKKLTIKLIAMQVEEKEKKRWAMLYDHGDYSKIAREISPSTQSYQVKKVMDTGEGSHIYVSAITRFYNRREKVMAGLSSTEQEV